MTWRLSSVWLPPLANGTLWSTSSQFPSVDGVSPSLFRNRSASGLSSHEEKRSEANTDQRCSSLRGSELTGSEKHDQASQHCPRRRAQIVADAFTPSANTDQNRQTWSHIVSSAMGVHRSIFEMIAPFGHRRPGFQLGTWHHLGIKTGGKQASFGARDGIRATDRTAFSVCTSNSNPIAHPSYPAVNHQLLSCAVPTTSAE